MLWLLLAQAPIEQTPYWDCLQRNTVRLERSGERPPDVANAALEACAAQAPALSPALMEKVRAKLLDKLAAEVVEIRTKR